MSGKRHNENCIIGALLCTFILADTPILLAEKNKSSRDKISKIKVGTFYDGQDGYSLSIPTGNESRCIWVYEGGNHSVPGIEVTSARTATQKHALRFPDKSFIFNFKVHCLDDFGNVYEGVFLK
jgi:hypothetical protein